MKTCGYCGRTYDDSQPRCPSCGSTLLKHSHGTDSAAADYDRIKKEIEDKRKSRSKILIGVAAAVVLVLVIIVVSTVAHVNNPQRGVDSNAKGIYESALSDYNAGNYDAALSALNSIDSSWSDYKKASELRQKAVLGMLNEKASGYMATGDYEAIIQLVNSNLDNVNGDAEIKRTYVSAVSSYRDQITTEAEQAYQSSGYAQALSIVNRGLSVLNGDAVLLALRSQYEAMAPVSLTSLTRFLSESHGSVGVTAADKLGNSYDDCIIYDYGYSEDRGDIYVLNYAYSSFRGTIFVPSNRSSGYDDWVNEHINYYLKIYGDGKLLYTSPSMLSTQYPVDFDIDVSGVDQLTVKWEGGAITWYVPIGIANAYLYK